MKWIRYEDAKELEKRKELDGFLETLDIMDFRDDLRYK